MRDKLSTMRFFFNRLLDKLKSIIPIVVGGIAVSMFFAGVIHFALDYIPESYREILNLLQSNSWDENKIALKDLFLSYGNEAWQVFILLQIFQVIIAPIPGQVAGLFGGFLFGFWGGLALTMLGVTIGSTIAMASSRILGIAIVRRFIPKTVLEKFDYLVERGGVFNFFMIFLLPVLPDDAICFIAGLTKLKLWHLLIVCVLGRLPGMAILTFTGASLDTNIMLAQFIFAFGMILALFFWLFDKELEEYFHANTLVLSIKWNNLISNFK